MLVRVLSIGLYIQTSTNHHFYKRHYPCCCMVFLRSAIVLLPFGSLTIAIGWRMLMVAGYHIHHYFIASCWLSLLWFGLRFNPGSATKVQVSAFIKLLKLKHLYSLLTKLLFVVCLFYWAIFSFVFWGACSPFQT